MINTFKSTTFHPLRFRQRIAHFAHHEDESSRGQVHRDLGRRMHSSCGSLICLYNHA